MSEHWQIRILHYRVNMQLSLRPRAKWKSEEEPLMAFVTGVIVLLSETNDA